MAEQPVPERGTAVPDLAKFRDAAVLRWNRATVFTPGRSADGTLYADDDPGGLPLDTYTTAELPHLAWTRRWADKLVALPSGSRVFPDGWSDSVIGIVADAADLSELHRAIRGWARDVLGRDDIQFTVTGPGGTFEAVGLDPAAQAAGPGKEAGPPDPLDARATAAAATVTDSTTFPHGPAVRPHSGDGTGQSSGYPAYGTAHSQPALSTRANRGPV